MWHVGREHTRSVRPHAVGKEMLNVSFVPTALRCKFLVNFLFPGPTVSPWFLFLLIYEMLVQVKKKIKRNLLLVTQDQWIGCCAVTECQSLCDPIHGSLRAESPAGVYVHKHKWWPDTKTKRKRIKELIVRPSFKCLYVHTVWENNEEIIPGQQ